MCMCARTYYTCIAVYMQVVYVCVCVCVCVCVHALSSEVVS